MCSSLVNTVCINTPFTVVTMGTMEDRTPHETAQRLLDAARVATSGLPIAQRVTDWASLKRLMPVGDQVLTNWKKRGLSEGGALQAEGRFGCSAWWLLHGERPAGWVQGAGSCPLTPELVQRLAKLAAESPDELRKVENGLRGQLDMDPVSRLGNQRAA